MKQVQLFNLKEKKPKSIYTSKIEAPVYEPKNRKPNLRELYNKDKTAWLILEIKKSNLPISEKKFLIDAAKRHIVFNYEKIADYYAHATPEMQRLMEESALVIIDFESAIEGGFVQLCERMKEQYLYEYPEAKNEE